MNETVVVNIDKGGVYDVLIDRTSPWGNFIGQGVANRSAAVHLHHAWLLQPEQKTFRARAKRELKGKRLGCHCKPDICHGDNYVELCDA